MKRANENMTLDILQYAKGLEYVDQVENITETEIFTRADLLNILDAFRTKSEKVKYLESQVGTLSETSKMRGTAYSYSTPSERCKTGSTLVDVVGSVCHGCYAKKGSYNWKPVKSALNVRFNAVVNNPFWHVYICELIRLKSRKKYTYFRWHDSGDIQSVKHLLQICWIADQLPDIKFWIPTRENKMVREVMGMIEIPQNLCIRVSNHMINSDKSARNFQNRSTVSDYITDNTCPATLPEQPHSCIEHGCTRCWNTSIDNVNYLLH